MELYNKNFLIYGNCMIRSFDQPGCGEAVNLIQKFQVPATFSGKIHNSKSNTISSKQKIAKVLTCCSDFRNESNVIFVIEVGFFFFRQISTL